MNGSTFNCRDQEWWTDTDGNHATTTTTWHSGNTEMTGQGVTGQVVTTTVDTVDYGNGPYGTSTTFTMQMPLPGTNPETASTGGETPVQTWWDWFAGQTQAVLTGVDMVSAFATQATTTGEQLATGLEQQTQQFVDGTAALVQPFADSAEQQLQNAIGTVAGAGQQLVDGFTQQVTSLWNTAVADAQQAVDTVAPYVQGAYDLAVVNINQSLNEWEQGVSKIWDGVKYAASNFWQGFWGSAVEVWNIGLDLGNAYGQAISVEWSWATGDTAHIYSYDARSSLFKGLDKATKEGYKGWSPGWGGMLRYTGDQIVSASLIVVDPFLPAEVGIYDWIQTGDSGALWRGLGQVSFNFGAQAAAAGVVKGVGGLGGAPLPEGGLPVIEDPLPVGPGDPIGVPNEGIIPGDPAPAAPAKPVAPPVDPVVEPPLEPTPANPKPPAAPDAPAPEEPPPAAGEAPQDRIPGASDAENRIDQYLRSKGHRVKGNPLEGARGAGRQGDRIIDGVKSELKSLDPGATSNTVRNVVNNSIRGGGQARNIIIDARGSGLTEAEAARGIARARGISRGKIDNIRIIGDGFDITN